MATEFKLPELGENIESADVTSVLVSEGDTIEKEQPVLEIETDKASVEVPSEVSGKITKIHVSEGDSVKTGDVVLEVEGEGEESGGDEDEETGEKETAEEETEEDNSGDEDETDESEEEPEEEEEEKTSAKSGGTVEFHLPDLGENIEEAEVTSVLVSEGDDIKVDDPVIEIETDKASVEVPSEVSGKIKEVKVSEGDTVKTGDVVIVVESSGGESKKEKKESAETTQKKPAEKKETKKEEKPKEEKSDKEKAAEKERKESADKKERTTPKHAGELVKDVPSKASMPEKIAPAAPTVRRFAREIGIEINQVNGSGPGGRISIDDVKKYAKRINEQVSKGEAGPIGIKREKLPDFTKWGDIDRQKMSNIRKKTAEHLSYAWATIPHVTQHDKADITDLEAFRKKYGKVVEKEGGKLTVTSILLKVISQAMKVYPQFNASVDMENKEIIYKQYFNIGVAVDTDRGLLVPVIRDVDKKNITQLSKELGEASVKARDGKLGLDDMQGGNFSISNLGGIGGTYFTPVVNSPEVAILGVSRGAYEPVYIDGEFKPRMMLPLSLSYDHRLIDGADAARFLRWVVQALENPFLIALEG